MRILDLIKATRNTKMRKDKTKRTRYITILVMVAICGSFLRAEEGKDLMDDLYAAIKNQDQTAAEEISQKLINMGDAAMPQYSSKTPILLQKRGFTVYG